MSLITLVSCDNKTVEIDIETALRMGTIRDLLLSTGTAGEEEEVPVPAAAGRTLDTVVAWLRGEHQLCDLLGGEEGARLEALVSLAEAADYLDIPPLLASCSQALVQALSPSTCFYILHLAARSRCAPAFVRSGERRHSEHTCNYL